MKFGLLNSALEMPKDEDRARKETGENNGTSTDIIDRVTLYCFTQLR